MVMRTVFRPASGPEWTVYRVETGSSTYQVGLFPGSAERRRCAVLRSVSRPDGTTLEVQDSDPRVEGRSLFEVPPHEWVGGRLEVGTVTTSPVRKVEEDSSPASRALVATVIARAPAPPLDPSTPPEGRPAAVTSGEVPSYPESMVSLIESAARRLRAAYEAHTLFDDLEGKRALLGRLEVALAECHLRLSALGGRLQTHKNER